MPNPTLVICRWSDAHTTEATQYAPTDIPHAPLVIETVGWLLRDDQAGVSIASERIDGTQFRGYTFIPRGMVGDVNPIIKPRKSKKGPFNEQVPPSPPPSV